MMVWLSREEKQQYLAEQRWVDSRMLYVLFFTRQPHLFYSIGNCVLSNKKRSERMSIAWKILLRHHAQLSKAEQVIVQFCMEEKKNDSSDYHQP